MIKAEIPLGATFAKDQPFDITIYKVSLCNDVIIEIYQYTIK